MLIKYEILAFVLAYFIGAIPSAVWIGRKFYGIDVRKHGSKNGGATNTIRILGFKAGIPVLLIDLLKGFVAVKLALLIKTVALGTDDYIRFEIFLGIAAVIGHIFPIYVGFKGGKGVATMFGFILAVHPGATLAAVGVFLITLFVSKYVSLSSLFAGFSFPIFILLIFKVTSPPLVVFSFIITIVLMITHQKNIERLLRGEESKASFLVRKKNKGNN